MAVLTNVDKDSLIITHKVTGELHFSDVIQALKSRFSLPDYKLGVNVIWDFSEATDTTISADEVKSISQFVTGDPGLNMRYKVALFADNDLAYGMSKMYKVISAYTKVEVEVFRDKSEAEKWVLN